MDTILVREGPGHLSTPCLDALLKEGAAVEGFMPLGEMRGSVEVKGKGRMQTYLAKAGGEWAPAAEASLPPSWSLWSRN